MKNPEQPQQVKGGGAKYSRTERWIWRGWQMLNTRPALYRSFLWAATRFRALAPKKAGPWTENHSAPVPARRSLHDLAARHLDQNGGRPS